MLALHAAAPSVLASPDSPPPVVLHVAGDRAGGDAGTVAGGTAARRNRLGLGLGVVSLSVDYARRTDAGSWVGFGAGVGGNLGNFTLLASDSRYGDGGRIEIVHLEGFMRWEPRPWLEYDLGLRANVHGHNAGASTWLELFFGGYGEVFVGFRRAKIGARMLAGAFPNDRMMGVNVSGLSARVAFPW